VRIYSFAVTEYDVTKPWLVRSTGHRTVELGEEEDFVSWADREFPRERYTVQLDPRLDPWPKPP
jgi:hypothetical protein